MVLRRLFQNKDNQDIQEYDVTICGGGLAGLTLARQIKNQMPDCSVALIDRLSRPLPDAAFKVGESTVELGAHYLGHVLGLTDYFEKTHFQKLGLRYFFGDSQGPFQDRPEFGLSEFPAVSSYQIDRGVLENDLRTFNDESGVILMEGNSVEDIALSEGDDPHEVVYSSVGDKSVGKVRSRWVIDATGRRRFLQKKLGLTKDGEKGRCSASWFRLSGRVNVSDLVSNEEVSWHSRVSERRRYFSTNHLMGDGYWVWLIPLCSDSTSIGIVALEDIHPFTEFNTYESSLNWLWKNEPTLASHIANSKPLDFRVMRRYSYTSQRVFSTERWACVGEAGAFSDPFYSPGTDLIGFGNSMTTEMIKLDLEGKLTANRVEWFNLFYLATNDLLTHNIQLGYPLFGNTVVMAAKLIWDFAVAWSLYCPQMFNLIFLDEEKNTRVRQITTKFFSLTQTMHQLFADWDSKSPGRCSYEFIDYLKIPLLNEVRTRNLKSNKDIDELAEDHIRNMEVLEELAQALFMVAVADVMPERLEEVTSQSWLNAWSIGLNPDRWQSSGLFAPTSQPRDLNTIWNEIRSQFGA